MKKPPLRSPVFRQRSGGGSWASLGLRGAPGDKQIPRLRLGMTNKERTYSPPTVSGWVREKVRVVSAGRLVWRSCLSQTTVLTPAPTPAPIRAPGTPPMIAPAAAPEPVVRARVEAVLA